MKNNLIVFKLLVTAVLVLALGFFIKKDFLNLKNFLAANPVAHSLQIQREKVKNKAMMVTINHYRPDLSLWEGFIIEGKPPGQGFLKDSVRYYEVIGSYVPDVAELYYMSGVCDALLGDAPAALAAQEKSVLLEPRFFWGWYNLGILYYRQGEFKKSSQAFKKALDVNPQATVKILSASKIYGEVLRGLGPAQAVANQHLQQGYRDAARMLEASILKYRGQPSGINEQQVQLKVF